MGNNNYNNTMELCFSSKSENEMLARTAIASFLMPLDPSVATINEVKTSVSELVTNSIVHGYERKPDGNIKITAIIDQDVVKVTVEDEGKGIADIEKALSGEVKFNDDNTTAGIGFQIIKSFVNDLKVEPKKDKGTIVSFSKKII